MPTYNFINEQGEVESHFMNYSELDKFTNELFKICNKGFFPF